MNLSRRLALALDPSLLLQAQGLRPDPWQRDFLLGSARQVLLNCCRQAGKSTVVAALALHTALFTPRALILLLSPSQRQSLELFRKILDAYDALGRPFATRVLAPSRGLFQLANGSRIVALPSREVTIRGFSNVALLIIDEAARVPDVLYRSVRPMLAVSQGRLVALSTPFGQQGFFFDEWTSEGPWQRVRVTHADCPRITDDFLREEERALGKEWVDQEYRCAFTALSGLVYPDFDTCLIDDWPSPRGKGLGGIDWGFNNPFAALWGLLDSDDILWIGGERYLRLCTLRDHVDALKAVCTTAPCALSLNNLIWYADPSGPADILECNRAGLKVRPGLNEIRLGIAAVTARLRTGRLRVLRSACPNLLAESHLYRYPTPTERLTHGENPIDAHNHALAALRYLICSLDQHYLARAHNKEV